MVVGVPSWASSTVRSSELYHCMAITRNNTGHNTVDDAPSKSARWQVAVVGRSSCVGTVLQH
jgi:hypothetical protein